MFEVNMVDAMKLDVVALEPNRDDAVKLDAVIAFPIIVENWITLVDIVFVRILEAVIVEFTVMVEIVIAFPTIVENWIIPVEIPFVNRDDVVVVDTLSVCTLIFVPDIVKKAMFVAVS
jgi:hypothetical protein